MCYHIQTPAEEEIVSDLSAFADDYQLNREYEKLYHGNGFDHPDVPIIPSGSARTVQLSQWGLIPSWVKDMDKARELQNMTLNATCEGVFDKPSFKGSVYKQRCVVIVNGFFENRHVGKKKYPYFVKLRDAQLFFLGGLYSQWADKSTGEVLHTCSIITTNANRLMAKVHNSKLRMPLIIGRDHLAEWLNPNATKDEINALMQPFDDSKMEAYTISPLVNNYRSRNTNVPEVADKAEYPELQMLDSME